MSHKTQNFDAGTRKQGCEKQPASIQRSRFPIDLRSSESRKNYRALRLETAIPRQRRRHLFLLLASNAIGFRGPAIRFSPAKDGAEGGKISVPWPLAADNGWIPYNESRPGHPSTNNQATNSLRASSGRFGGSSIPERCGRETACPPS